MTNFIIFTLVPLFLFFAFHSAIGYLVHKPPIHVKCDHSLGEIFSLHARLNCSQNSCVYELVPAHRRRPFQENKILCRLGPGCVCPEPLIRESDDVRSKCVPKEECSKPAAECNFSLGEVFSSNAPERRCQDSCAALLLLASPADDFSIDKTSSCIKGPGCVCPHPLIRGPNGKCVPKEECCDSSLGEVFSERTGGGMCGQQSCFNVFNPYVTDYSSCGPSKPGCVCPEPFVREHKEPGAMCVPRRKCV